MGKITGFLEFERIAGGGRAASTSASSTTASSSSRSTTQAASSRARAAWTAASRSARAAARSTTSFRTGTTWCTGSTGRTALDVLHSTNNFPEFTGRDLPGAVRGGVHAEHQRRSGRHQVDRARHHRQGLGGGLGRAAAAGAQDRQAGRGGRLGPGGPRVRAAARARRPRRRGVREERPHRRAAALRHPRLQDGEAPDRPAHGADGGRRRRVPSRASHVGGNVAARADCWPSSTRSCWPAAPSSRATCRCPGASSTACISRWSSCRSRTSVVAGDRVADQIVATGKHVIVIGGGDTGSDCVGTSNRQGAASITQFELLPQPPDVENKPLVWPYWPIKLRTSSSHEEGCERDWSVATKRFEGSDGKVEKLVAARVEWQRDGSGATQDGRGAGQRVRDEGRPGAARDGLRRARCRRASLERSASSATRAATSRRTPTTTARTRAEGVRRRRHAPRPVAGRLGDPRRPAGARAVDEFLMGASSLPR